MKKLFTLLLSAACFTASAQSDIDYPYNPDFENDGFVGIEDVLELLSVYGAPFTPEQLLLDGASLTEIIESLQTQIDSLASYTNDGFGALVLNDSLLTEYLVGVAAASEEGDSTLAAWVMQLSVVVEQQQAQIDSLLEDEAFPLNEAGQLAFGAREVWQVPIEVSYISDWGYPLVTHYSPGEDGFMITPQNAICPFNGFDAFIVPKSFQHETSTWQELTDARVTYYDHYSEIGLIPIGADEKLLIQLEEDETDCFPQEFVWLPITQTVGEVVDSDPATFGSVEIDPIGVLDESLLPAPQANGCTQRAILRDDLSMDAWGDVSSVVGATSDEVFFLDGFLRLWTIKGDNDLSLFSSLPFGLPVPLESCGSPCGLICQDGISEMLSYVSDSLVVLGVGFNRNVNCGDLRGVHIIRPNGEHEHVSLELPDNNYNNVYSRVQFEYPWVTWNKGNQRFYINVFSHEHFFSDVRSNGILHDGALIFVDDYGPQSNPEYGWLKSFNIESQETTLLLDLKSVPNSNFYEFAGNGAQYAVSFDFTLAKGPEGLAIFKDYNGSREGQVVLCGTDGSFQEEYLIETWNGTLPLPVTCRYNSSGDLGFTIRGAFDFVLDGLVFSSSSSELVLNPWSKLIYTHCRPEAVASYSVGGPDDQNFDIWPVPWQAHSPQYFKSLGIQRIWFY